MTNNKEHSEHLFATAGSLEGIKKSIKQFYMGESKKLVKTDGYEYERYELQQPSGETLEGVRVIKKGRRYIFETFTTN
ncbi:hypothetical protein OAB00_01375 [Akkermansiaceae bacterium]|nr:hypothetical protein [Akkermansiaceae bacterium]